MVPARNPNNVLELTGLMKHLDVGPLKAARGTIKLPGSKSISNRVLLLAALAQGETVVRELLDSDDTRVMLAALDKLGVSVERLGDNDYRVTGTGGFSTGVVSLVTTLSGWAAPPGAFRAS